jgi:Icc-related predicted phosphoesterase
MTLKLVHISDTHLKAFPTLPEADILIHTGDALNSGDFSDLIKFRQQLDPIHHKFKKILFLPGNHDWAFQHTPLEAENFLKETIPNIEIMHEREYTYDGYKFFGTSYQPYFGGWAYNIPLYNELAEFYDRIPEDTEVLLTHCPPKGILDSCIWDRVGSEELLQRLNKLNKLKLHCFGHIHYSHGLHFNGSTLYSNGAICTEEYKPLNGPNIIELGIKNV